MTDLDFLAGDYDFVLDVGCGHALNAEGFDHYHAHIKRLLRPGGKYLLYARLREEEHIPEEGPKGMPEELLRTTFSDGFELVKVERGITEVEGMEPWESAWFYFKRAA